MTLLTMRQEYERIRSEWRSRPPAEHRFDLQRLGELRDAAVDSADEGTERLVGGARRPDGSDRAHQRAAAARPPDRLPRAQRRDVTAPAPDDRWAPLLADYRRHLQFERGVSAATVRAYVADITDLLDHLTRMKRDLAGLDLAALRSWLARLATTGIARSSLARKAAAARSFTGWAHRTDRITSDPGARLAAPRAHRALPGVLRADQAAAMLVTPVTSFDPRAPQQAVPRTAAPPRS